MLEKIPEILASSEEWAKTARPLAELPAQVYDDVSSFLGKLCGPAGEELGLVFKDKIRAWRMANLATVLAKAESKIGADKVGQEWVSPRVLTTVAESASLCEDDTLQEMWAGLISGAGSLDGLDDHNLIYAEVLKSTSVFQARLINKVYDNLLGRLDLREDKRPPEMTKMTKLLNKQCLLSKKDLASLCPRSYFGSMQDHLKEEAWERVSEILLNITYVHPEIIGLVNKNLIVAGTAHPNFLREESISIHPTIFGFAFYRSCQGRKPIQFLALG